MPTRMSLIAFLIMTNFHLYLIKLVAIFPNVCLWRRSYDQNWEVLTLKNCYSIERPSFASAAYVVASYDPRFFSTVRFVKIRATCENFLGKWFTARPGKKIPVRLWLVLTFDKHKICKEILKELRFHMIKDLLCLFFINGFITMCNLKKRLIRAAF